MPPVVLVTGASSDIGQTISKILSGKGFTVYTSTSDTLDVTSDTSCQKFVSRIITRSKRLDVVVNVVGLTQSGPGLSSTPSDLQRLLDINSTATLRLLRYTAPYLQKSRPGKFIAICSLSGLVAFPNFSLYSASKFALRGLCLSLYHELKRQGVFLTCVSPGAVAKQGAATPPNSARARIPLLARLLPLTTPGQVADAIVSVIQSPHPPAEKIVGRDAVVLSFLFRFLPGSIWHTLQDFVWQKQQ